MTKYAFTFIVFVLFISFSFGQDITRDTTLAGELLESGINHIDSSDYNTALKELQKAAFLYKKHKVWEQYLYCRQQEALVYRYQEKYPKSEKTILDVIRETKGLVDTMGVNLAYSYWTLARAYQMLDENEKALGFFNRSLKILIKKGPSEYVSVADLYWFRGKIFRSMKEYQKAIYELNDALRFAKQVTPPNKAFIARIYYNLGFNYEKTKKLEKALDVYEECIVSNEGQTDNQIYTGWAYDNSAIIYGQLNQLDKQIEFNRNAIDIYRKVKGANYKYIGYCYENIAWSYENKGKFDSAIIYRGKAIKIEEQNGAIQDLAYNFYKVGYNYHSLGNADSALKYYHLHFEKIKSSKPTINTAYANFNTGQLLFKTEPEKALGYYKKSYNIKLNFYDKTNIYLAEDLEKIIYVHKQLSQTDSAIKYSKLVLKLYENNLSNNVEILEKAADISFRIAYDYHDNQSDSALRYYKIHNKLAEKLDAGYHMHTPYSYYNMGNIYYEKKDFLNAISKLKISLELKRSLINIPAENFAINYKKLGLVFQDSENYDSAIVYYKQAAKYYLETGDTISAIERYFNLGFNYQLLENYDSTLVYYQKFIDGTALYPLKEFANKKHVVNNLANLYYSKKDYQKAAEFHKQIIHDNLAENEKNNTSLFGNYNDLANCFHNNAEYDSALFYYRVAEKVLDSQEEPDTLEYMTVNRNLGGSFKQKGILDSAFFYYRKALKYGLEFNPSHFQTADTYRLIGVAHQNIENYDSALYYMDKYMTLVKETKDFKRPETAHTFNNYGIIYEKEEEYDSAIINYNHAIDIYTAVEGESSSSVGLVYRNIGLVYRKLDVLDTAMMFFQKSLEIYQQYNHGINEGASDALLEIAKVYNYKDDFDSALIYYDKAIAVSKKVYGNFHLDVVDKTWAKALLFERMHRYDSALVCYFRNENILKRINAEHTEDNALNYKNIGLMYVLSSKPDSAIKYLGKAYDIFTQYFPEKKDQEIDYYSYISKAYHYVDKFYEAIKWQKLALKIAEQYADKYPMKLATNYGQMGVYLTEIAEYENALEYHQKELSINLKQKSPDEFSLALSYQAVGVCYTYMKEYHLALEYYNKALSILIKRKVKPYKNIAVIYANIGQTYTSLKEYNKAIAYLEKSNETLMKVSKSPGTTVADNYKNIGAVYYSMEEYSKALEFANKAIDIYKDLKLENSLGVGIIYSFMANIYQETEHLDKALEYHKKSYEIERKVYAGKHHFLALLNSNIAAVYYIKGQFEKVLEYAHKSLCDNLRGYNAAAAIYECPPAKNYLNWLEGVRAYQKKALAMHELVVKEKRFDLLPQSLKHFQACDTILNEARKEMKTKADKIKLGQKAYDLYDDAMVLCRNYNYYIDSLRNTGVKADKKLAKRINQPLLELSFYFAEKNKSSVLLESLAGAEAQKFAGIPEELLAKERQLSAIIVQYKKMIADGESDKSIEDKLFSANRSYDSLMAAFEKDYPKYHELKYNHEPASIKQIARNLDKKTAVLSYFTGYNTIFVHLLSKSIQDFYIINKIAGFDEKIDTLRNSISNTGLLKEELRNNTNKSVLAYNRLAFEIYHQLFKEQLEKDLLKSGVENLVIVPDGKIATIPFEALFTKQYKKEWSGWRNKKYFSEMPFLVKKFNISYSYSSKLFYQTFLGKSKKQTKIEITPLNDWLALAPVFEDENISGTTLRTRQMIENATTDSAGIGNTRAFLRDGTYISALPGSETETKEIFNLFDQNNKKALLKTHGQANEEFIKSGELEKYKYIHFATHGIVNADKPELSAVLLAQTNSKTEDDILYSGELYNLKLNAELTVLSACETGLGKIAEGEGVVGLTRALLYAGSKNIIVSLWQVSDASTKELMIEFYTGLLKENQSNFSKHLRNAKLNLINKGSYAHPFFWSPFILIGR